MEKNVEKAENCTTHFSINGNKPKGKSLLRLADNYVSLDVETTGLDSEADKIIEIGAVKVMGGKIVDEFTELVNPKVERSREVKELTDITDEELADAPEIKEVMPDLLDFVDNMFIVAHNAYFDIKFINKACVDLNYGNFPNNFIDTYRFTKGIFKDSVHNHKLSTLVREFNLTKRTFHRAILDCLCVYELYEFIKQHIKKNNIDFMKLCKRKRKEIYGPYADEITSQKKIFDKNCPIFGKIVVVTGKLKGCTRREIMQKIVDSGGMNADRITKQSDFLILGDNSECETIKDGKSNKQKTAEKYILAGQNLQIISEEEFYALLETNKFPNWYTAQNYFNHMKAL